MRAHGAWFSARWLIAACVLGVAACNAILGIEETQSIDGVRQCPDGGCPPGDGDGGDGDGDGDGGPRECEADDPRPECSCEPGYQYIDGNCVRISACDTDNGGCPVDADCAESGEKVTCTCKSGFADPNGDGSECVDLCSLADCPPEFSTCSVVDEVAECACEPSYLFVEAENICIFDEACSELGCHKDASCVLDGDERACECKPGFTGDGFDCENPDACDPDPCLNGGACEDGLDSFECACANGFAGDTCETDIDDCASSPCQNEGTCIDGVASYECMCMPGFEGPSCATNVDDCAPNPCANDGTCEDLVNGFDCECAMGFAGDTCDENVADCRPGLCENGGTCTDLVNGYMCTCADGFSGEHCGTNDDDCDPDPCERGTCTDLVDDFMCNCPAGWDGDTCDHNIDNCASTPCVRGTCTDLINDYSCSCPPGYDGKTCANNVDECASNPCVRGTCSDLVNGYMCNCPNGWEGNTCNVNHDDCDPNPCARGTCSDLLDDYTCNCPAGWEGDTCNINHNDCSPNPCDNGGSCTDQVNDFSCTCVNGWSGDTCTTAPACTPNVDFCESGTRYARDCTSSGTLGTRTECWTQALPDGRTCVNGACTGECSQGRASCQGQQPVLCDATGDYDSVGSPCMPPNTYCSAGACVNNPVSPLGLNTSTGTTRTMSGSHFYATRVRTGAAQASLRFFGILGAANGGNVRLAVYTDAVDGGVHYPNALHGIGLSNMLGVTTAAQETGPNGSITLAANTDYWVVAITGSASPQVYAQAASSGTDVYYAPFPAGFTFSSAFPATFPLDGFGTDPSLRYSLYLRVQNVVP